MSSTVLPSGFLGSRGDILMDIVIVAFLFIVPALIFSWSLARKKQYLHHKRWQLTIFTILLIAVTLFEADMMLSGGIFTLTEASAYSNTTLLNTIIYSHTLIAVLSAIIWLGLVIASLIKFDNPPSPNRFSKMHKVIGRTGMVTMMLAGLSAIPVYYVGFVL